MTNGPPAPPGVAAAPEATKEGPQLLAGLRHWLAAVRLERPWLPDLAAGLDQLGTRAAHLPGLGAGAALVALRVVGGATATIMVLVAVVIFFAVAMNLESHILIPRLMSRVLGLSPLLTIIALFVSASD